MSDFRWRVSLVVEFDEEFEAAVEEVLRVPAVLLGAEMGGDNEEALLMPVARVVSLPLKSMVLQMQKRKVMPQPRDW